MAAQKFRVQPLLLEGAFEEEPTSYRMLKSGDHYVRLACPKKYWDKDRKR